MLFSFKYGKLKIIEAVLKEILKDIEYVKEKPPVFDMPSYNIRSGKIRVRKGDYIHFVQNEMFTCAFTISTFINGVFTI